MGRLGLGRSLSGPEALLGLVAGVLTAVRRVDRSRQAESEPPAEGLSGVGTEEDALIGEGGRAALAEVVPVGDPAGNEGGDGDDGRQRLAGRSLEEFAQLLHPMPLPTVTWCRTTLTDGQCAAGSGCAKVGSMRIVPTCFPGVKFRICTRQPPNDAGDGTARKTTYTWD